MNLTNITELCDIQIGRTPKRSEVKYWGNGHSWIYIADMCEKYVYDSKEEVTNLAVEECRMKIVHKNTVVMSVKLTICRLGITMVNLKLITTVFLVTIFILHSSTAKFVPKNTVVM